MEEKQKCKCCGNEVKELVFGLCSICWGDNISYID
jgi:NMD protein affecting ribosome stability and mRNA decay